MLQDEKDADETVDKGATRKKYRDSIFSASIFLLLAGGCENLHNFFCLLSFTQFPNLLVGKLIF